MPRNIAFDDQFKFLQKNTKEMLSKNEMKYLASVSTNTDYMNAYKKLNGQLNHFTNYQLISKETAEDVIKIVSSFQSALTGFLNNAEKALGPLGTSKAISITMHNLSAFIQAAPSLNNSSSQESLQQPSINRARSNAKSATLFKPHENNTGISTPHSDPKYRTPGKNNGA